MNAGLDRLIDLYQFPSGRAAYALGRAAAAAEARGEADLAARARAARGLATETRGLELRFRLQQQAPLYGPRAAALDGQLDRTLTALQQAIAARLALAEGGGASDPAAAAAARLDRELLPRGVAHVTSLSFVEEHESVTLLVARLSEGGDLAADAVALGLGPFVARLRALNDELGPELANAPAHEGPTWDQVRAARARHQRALLAYVAAALGAHLSDEDADLAARRDLLGPLLEQQDALAALYKARRGVRDVDPQSGLEDPEPTLPDPA